MKIGMIVYNTCHSDARVLREAHALAEAGHQVRIVALANTEHPEGVTIHAPGVEIQRLRVRSAYVMLFVLLGWIYHLLRGTRRLIRRSERRRMQGDYPVRSRRQIRDALARMQWWRRERRNIRRRHAARGRRYRWRLRGIYLNVHRTVRHHALFLHRPTMQAGFWLAGYRALCEFKPAVIHAHDANTLPAAAHAARATGAKLVYDSHELWRHRNRARRAPLGRLADAAMESRYIRRADAVITVSPGIVTWLENHYRLSDVHLLRNVPNRITPAATAPDLRSLAGIDADDQVVLYTGRITTSRGIEETIDALPHLPERVHLVMLGYGDRLYIEQLHHRARERRVEHRLHQVGPVRYDQVPATAAQANMAIIAVQPTCLSYLHCLPNKAFEAIQAGLPIVANNLPDLAHLLRTHGVGEVFLDARGMRQAIGDVIGDGARFREAAKVSAAELCWEREQKVLLDLYAALTAAAPRESVEHAERGRYRGTRIPITANALVAAGSR